MRLLHLDSDGKLRARDFDEVALPPYTILSHRWGKEEILPEDVLSEFWTEKKGRQKIDFCVTATARDEFQYFWIDTCCIDKWNLQELSQSINLMYQWYHKAHKCYVFLPDVSVSSEAEVAQRSSWEQSFRRSEWFTRGWTLQELLAPPVVEFYCCKGWYLGDKTVLQNMIHEVTGIPLSALQPIDARAFSIEECMSWVQGRKTQEPEDMVYCLLGLVGVQMSVSYGEGFDAATERLRVELNATTTASHLLPPRNLQFVGREAQLVEIDEILSNSQSMTHLAIIGARGMGKSQVALEFAHRYKIRHSDCRVLWIDASNIDNVYRSYTNICQKIRITGLESGQNDIVQLFKHHFSQPGTGRWLLIYDKADSTTLESTGSTTPFSAELADLLPVSQTGCIVFTSINGSIVTLLGISNVIQLTAFTRKSARQVLQNLAQRSTLAQDESFELDLLLCHLSNFPAALVQAATYIKIHGCTFSEYRSLLYSSKLTRLGISDASAEALVRNEVRSDPTLATLLVSLLRIHLDCRAAANHLFLAACMEATDIPTELFGPSSSKETSEQLKMLERYGLLTRRPMESAIDVNRLAQEGIRIILSYQDSSKRRTGLELWHWRAIGCITKVFPSQKYTERGKWRRLLPHAMHALSIRNQSRGHVTSHHSLLRSCGAALHQDGRYREAAQLRLEVVEIEKLEFGADNPLTLISMNNLASTYSQQARWSEAEHLHLQVLETCRATRGAEDPMTLNSMDYLASTYGSQRRWKDAEQLFLQVLDIRQKNLGQDHPDTLSCTQNLVHIYKSQGRLNEAEKLQLLVLETRERQLGSKDASTLDSMAGLAAILQMQNRWQESEEMQLRVMEARKTQLGPDHPTTITTIRNLAITKRSMGQHFEAVELLTQSVDARRRILGDSHPNYLSDLALLQKWIPQN